MKRKFTNTDREYEPRKEKKWDSRRALSESEGEEKDPSDDYPSKQPINSPYKRNYLNRAGYRWLDSHVGQKWNEIRADFMREVKGDQDVLRWAVYEKVSMIDGILCALTPIGPHNVNDLWGSRNYYVDIDGVLCKAAAREKYKHTPKTYFLIEKNQVWFRDELGCIFCIDSRYKITDELEMYVRRNQIPKFQWGSLYPGFYSETPETLRRCKLPMSKAKQISPEKAPKGVDSLTPIKRK